MTGEKLFEDFERAIEQTCKEQDISGVKLEDTVQINTPSMVK